MTAIVSTPRATYDGTTIILNLPDAINPTVWRYDLSYVPGASFEIVPDGATHCLRMKTSSGTAHTIALYTSKEAAVQVLSMIIETISTPQTATPAHTNVTTKWDTRPKRMALLSVIIFISLSTLFFTMVAVPRQDPRLSKPTQITDTPSQSASPRAADDILKERLHEK